LWFRDDQRDTSIVRAGVVLMRSNTWVDPAMVSADIPRFDLTLVSPKNYQRPDRPWRPSLDTLLTEAWSYEDHGRRLATLYRVRTN